jgi:hypothetical protein
MLKNNAIGLDIESLFDVDADCCLSQCIRLIMDSRLADIVCQSKRININDFN